MKSRKIIAVSSRLKKTIRNGCEEEPPRPESQIKIVVMPGVTIPNEQKTSNNAE